MNLLKYKVIFWDFDGVIKESHAVKTDSFIELFNDQDKKFIDKVSKHHIKNGGISRFKKIPLYLKWLGKDTNKNIKNYIQKFEDITVGKVINSKWVPGSLEYIVDNHSNQIFYVITGTPHNEMKLILEELNIIEYFKNYFGSPKNKIEAIQRTLKQESYNTDDCIMIGDAHTDYEAALKNNIDFLLRIHNENKELFKNYKGMTTKDFIF